MSFVLHCTQSWSVPQAAAGRLFCSWVTAARLTRKARTVYDHTGEVSRGSVTLCGTKLSVGTV